AEGFYTRPMRNPFLCVVLTSVLAVSCGSSAGKTDDTKSSIPSVINADNIKTHIQKLSSDEMEGRAPGSKGEELATTYIADYMKSLGLKTQMQAVPLVGVTSTASP